MADDQNQGASISQSLTTMFGTPFLTYQWPDSDQLNQELHAIVLAEEASDDAGRGIRSNAGPRQHSDENRSLYR